MKMLLAILLLAPAFVTAQTKKKQPLRPRPVTIVSPSAPPQSTGHGVVAMQRSADDTLGIIATVDVPPAFPGGRAAWIRFLQLNISAAAVSDADQHSFGRRQSVRVEFIVCEDGSLCNYNVVNKYQVGQSAANEALRVMRKSPKWEPGTYKNKNVKARFIQPITFMFEE